MVKLDIVDNWVVFITVGVVLFIFFIFTILGCDLDRRDAHRLTHNVTPAIISSSCGDSVDADAISVSSALQNVLSPYFRLASSWKQRCWGEMKLYHPYVNLFSRHIREYSRPLRSVSLLLNIILVFCIQAVIFTRNSLCDHSSTQIECEAQWLTAWVKTTSVCYWDESGGGGGGDHCSTLQIGGSFQLSLKVALLSAVFSIPLMLLFNGLIIYILASDTKSIESKVSAIDVEPTGVTIVNHRHRKHNQLLDVSEKQATTLFGCSLSSEVEQFQQEFQAYLKTRTPVDAKQMQGTSCL
jgi:hypothetical protein